MSDSCINVSLVTEQQWRKFAPNTEMLVTKPGRCLFPVLEYKVEGLSPTDFYVFEIKMERVDDKRYTFYEEEWQIAGKAERQVVSGGARNCTGYKTGAEWMMNNVSFDKIKLTNDEGKQLSHLHILVQSMHRYIPVLFIGKIGHDKSVTVPVAQFRFDFTKFYAVTCYQSVTVLNLKKEMNKHAYSSKSLTNKRLSKENRKRVFDEIVLDDSDDLQNKNEPSSSKVPPMMAGFYNYPINYFDFMAMANSQFAQFSYQQHQNLAQVAPIYRSPTPSQHLQEVNTVHQNPFVYPQFNNFFDYSQYPTHFLNPQQSLNFSLAHNPFQAQLYNNNFLNMPPVAPQPVPTPNSLDQTQNSLGTSPDSSHVYQDL